MRVDSVVAKEYNRITVAPLTGSIGAEIRGVDLRDADDEVIAEIQDAWLQHKVLFFRNQNLTQAQHVAYGRRLGQLEIHPFVRSVEAHPEIIVLESTPEKFSAAEFWHSDVTFRPDPPLGSVLFGRCIPEHGGDTLWANMELAYEGLTDEIKEQIDGCRAIHSYLKTFGKTMSPEQREKAEAEHPDQSHPIVRTHPVTGAKSLFVNRPFTLTIEDMERAEARALLEKLWHQAEIPEFQCRFRWQPNSIAQWDNRCTQHYAVPDYGGHSRRVERVTLIGTRPE